MTLLRQPSYTTEELKALRTEAGLSETVNLFSVAAVVEEIGDFELALDALTMIPRPAWVSETLGLHPERKVGA